MALAETLQNTEHHFSGAYGYARLNNMAKMEDLIQRGLQLVPNYRPAEYRSGLSDAQARSYW